MNDDHFSIADIAVGISVVIMSVGLFVLGFKTGKRTGNHEAQIYKGMAEQALKRATAYDLSARLILKNWKPELSSDEIAKDVEELEQELEPTCSAKVGILF